MSAQLEGSPSACGQSMGPAVLEALQPQLGQQSRSRAGHGAEGSGVSLLGSGRVGLCHAGGSAAGWCLWWVRQGQVRSGFTLSFSVESWACSKHWEVVSSWLSYL